jgi:hypothetical protein
MAGTYPAPHRHSSTQHKLCTTIFGEILHTRLGNAADGSRGQSAAGRAGLDDTGRAWLGAGLVQVASPPSGPRRRAHYQRQEQESGVQVGSWLGGGGDQADHWKQAIGLLLVSRYSLR